MTKGSKTPSTVILNAMKNLNPNSNTMLKITEAEFITSAAKKEQFLHSEKPIIAVCGKSNVGKSSFINMLANRKKLAKTSKDPGRTRLVNYFGFGSFIIADLPGYGFARVSKEEKQRWARLLDDFFAEKQAISRVFALVDLRHEPTADDKQMIEFLVWNGIPFTVIATKADKLSRAAIARNKTAIAAQFKCGVDNIIAVSAVDKTGLEGVLTEIEKVITIGENNEAT